MGMPMPRASFAACLLLVCAACWAAFGGGCASGTPSNGAAADSRNASPTDPPGPSLLGPDIGLEVQVTSTVASAASIAGALQPYLNEPTPFPPQQLSMWRANGLRVVAVPLAELPGVFETIGGAGSAASNDRQWMGQVVRWSPVYRGSAADVPGVLALDTGRLELPEGRFRLLLRGWVAPAFPDASVSAPSTGRIDGAPPAVLRVELVPQFQDGARRGASAGSIDDLSAELFTLDAPRLDAIQEGQTFDRMLLRGLLGPTRAIVIVSDRPDADWTRSESMLAEREPSSTLETLVTDAPADGTRGVGSVIRNGSGVPTAVPSNSDPGDPASPSLAPTYSTRIGPQGPSAGVLPTLGEAMLGGEWGAGRSSVAAPVMGESRPDVANPHDARWRRSIVVLVPRLPPRYTLLGTVGRGGE